MKFQVISLADKGIIEPSFIGLDSTPISTNTSHNNPKSFLYGKFKSNNSSISDMDCKLGIHTASNLTHQLHLIYLLTLIFLPVTENTFLADKGYDV